MLLLLYLALWKFEVPSPLTPKILRGTPTFDYALAVATTEELSLPRPLRAWIRALGWKRTRPRLPVLYLFDRRGEIVWIRKLDRRFFSFGIQLLEDDSILGVGYVSRTEFVGIEVGKSGRLRELFHLAVPELLRRPHHDVLLSKDGTFLSFGREFRQWFADKKDYAADTILHWDPKTGQSKTRWKLFDVSTPLNEEEWSPFAHPYSLLHWSEGKFAYDFSHANTLHRSALGLLVTAKSIPKLYFLDPSATRVLWTVGSLKKDTYRVEGRATFLVPHHGGLLPNGHVLLFDNGHDRSRILELKLDKKSGRALLETECVPSPAIRSDRFGSVQKLAGGNFVGFFPKNTLEADRPDYLVECDASGREVARIRVGEALGSVSQRLYLLSAHSPFIAALPSKIPPL